MSRRRELAAVAVFALVAAAVFTWPLVTNPVSRLAAPIGPGDPYLNLWILGWDLQTLSQNPAALVTGRVFDANIFFPARGTLAYSDHLIPQAVALWPLFALTGRLVLCYNALLFFSLAGSVLAMYVYARSVTGSRPGALLAGLAWGFLPFRFAHLLHLQLQSLYLLPVAFLFLHRLVAGRRRRDALWLGLTAGLQGISSVYWAVAGAMALVVAAGALAVGVGRWRSALLARRLLAAGLVGIVVLAPFAWPYWVVQRREGFSRNLYEASQHEAVLASYLRVPPGNWLYGRTGWLRPPTGVPASRHEGPEQELFPGFALAALALFGFRRAWRSDARPLAIAMAAVAGAGLVVSLGPDGLRSVYAALHRAVFGFQAIRAPARFGVLVGFALAVMAAVGVREVLASLRSSRLAHAVAACLIAVVGVEFVNVPIPTVAAPPRSGAASRWLRDAPGPGAVVHLPLDTDVGNTPAMLESLVHGRPIVNGYSGQRPAFFMGLADTLRTLPSAESLWTLRDLGVRFIVSPSDLPGLPVPALEERARLDGTVVYELVWSPEIEARLPRPEPPPPPEPGPAPFAERERAVYRVMWLSGAALGVPAGRAVITGERVAKRTGGDDGERPGFRVAVEVESADWVKRFFEARDRFETSMDGSLLPSAQAQRIREGRRRIDRTIRFDHGRRIMTVGDGPALPLAAGARDALAGFLYARTLPFSPGYEARFPIAEGGRRVVAALRVSGSQSAMVAGQPVEAWRVDARFETRSERRPITARLLLSRDARRVPIEILVDAGFGSFKVELVSYEAR